MLTYDVLATLWSAPSTDADVAGAVADRSGIPCSPHLAYRHLSLLRTTGYVDTRDANGVPVYVLTESGSALLSQLAGAMCAPTEA